MNDMVDDFWGHLPVEWDRDTKAMRSIKDGAGRTDDQLDTMETRLGIKLPALFREQYKIQNGGYPLKEIYVDESLQSFVGRWRELYMEDKGHFGVFVNDSHMSPITGQEKSFRDYLLDGYDEDEIAKYFDGWDLDKLVIISFMWGHSYLLLDYGYKGKPLDPPHVVCMETDNYEEQFRVESYELFVSRLGEYREEDYA